MSNLEKIISIIILIAFIVYRIMINPFIIIENEYKYNNYAIDENIKNLKIKNDIIRINQFIIENK